MPFAHSAIRINRKSTCLTQRAFRLWGFAILGMSALLPATAAPAASSLSEAKATYQKERAACISGRSHQDRATCLREAGAAYGEAKRGRLNDGPAQYEKNAMIRCNPLPPDDREACQRRMKGEGATKGTVESGGVLREIVTPEVAPQDSPMPADSKAGGASPGEGSQEGGTK